MKVPLVAPSLLKRVTPAERAPKFQLCLAVARVHEDAPIDQLAEHLALLGIPVH